MKKYFRKLASLCVTFYAERLYKKAVKEAEKTHGLLKERIYVVSSWGDVSQLLVVNRDNFRDMKKALNMKDTLTDLKAGSWYYTACRNGSGALPEKEKEIRRLAFVHHMLIRANLLSE